MSISAQSYSVRATGEAHYAPYHLIAYRGPRRGEATLRSQRVQIGWEVEEGEPKTDAGERTVALDTTALRVLHAPAGAGTTQ